MHDGLSKKTDARPLKSSAAITGERSALGQQQPSAPAPKLHRTARALLEVGFALPGAPSSSEWGHFASSEYPNDRNGPVFDRCRLHLSLRPLASLKSDMVVGSFQCNAAILPSMAPKSRRVRGHSTSNSQEYRACSSSRPPSLPASVASGSGTNCRSSSAAPAAASLSPPAFLVDRRRCDLAETISGRI